MADITLRRRPNVVPLDSAEGRARSARRKVGAVWGLLFFNTLTYTPGGLIHLPSVVGKAIAEGALPVAILVALTVNPKARLRPSAFLCLLGLLVVDTVITCTATRHIGTVFRTFRLAEFVVALWLLTPWWGRHDMLLLRFQLRCLYTSLVLVAVGIVLSPGKAFADGGRLSGTIWPMGATQVAQYAAVAAGLTVVLWLARMVSGRKTLFGVTSAVILLVLTHTRTALVGLVAGILVAGLSLFIVNARVRKFFATAAATISIVVLTLASVLTTWLARGESTRGLMTLTGRTNFWALVLNTPRTRYQEIFGFGLSNASINGLPIDSNWMASYMMEGIFGVVVCALILVFLYVTAFFQPHRVQRALAIFLITYCTLASYTEVGFTDVTTYMLHLAVAASLLAAPLPRRAKPQAVSSL